MAITEGKRNSIAAGVAGDDRREYPSHAPMFVGYGEAPANSVSGERLQPPQPRPGREASRTLAEARGIGLSMPEALDLTPAEVASWLEEPPQSPPRSTEAAGTCPRRLGTSAEGSVGSVDRSASRSCTRPSPGRRQG